MSDRDTAADIVVLIRRFVALGGSTSSGPILMDPPRDVLALVDRVLAYEPRAWKSPRGNTPGIAAIRVDGVDMEVWGVDRPAVFDDAWESEGQFGEHYAAAIRAGRHLVEIADLAPRRNRAQKAA